MACPAFQGGKLPTVDSHDVQRTSQRMHRQGPTSVQVLKIKKIHVTTELSGYLLVRGLKLSWFRSISYTKGKILNAPIEAVRPFWIYIHMAGTGTTC